MVCLPMQGSDSTETLSVTIYFASKKTQTFNSNLRFTKADFVWLSMLYMAV